MTKQELRKQIEPIVLDKTLTKEQRSIKLADVASVFLANADGDEYELDEIFEAWDDVMAQIVMDNNLGAVH